MVERFDPVRFDKEPGQNCFKVHLMAASPWASPRPSRTKISARSIGPKRDWAFFGFFVVPQMGHDFLFYHGHRVSPNKAKLKLSTPWRLFLSKSSRLPMMAESGVDLRKIFTYKENNARKGCFSIPEEILLWLDFPLSMASSASCSSPASGWGSSLATEAPGS